MTARGKPPRQDTATSISSPRGGNNGYQDQKRYKPQFYTTLSYFKDGWGGSHDFEPASTGSATAAASSTTSRSTSGTATPTARVNVQVDIYNSPVTGINDVVYTAGWINDTCKVTNRLTLNLGVRFENYKDRVAGSGVDAERHPGARRLDRSRAIVHFVAPQDVRRRPWPTPRRSRRSSASPTT